MSQPTESSHRQRSHPPRPGCKQGGKAVRHQLMENCKFQASILKTAQGDHLFIYLSIHSFFFNPTSIFLYSGFTKIVNAGQLTEAVNMTGFITVLESRLSVEDNQHVKHGLVVITSSLPHSFRSNFVNHIHLVLYKLMEMNHENVSFDFFRICICHIVASAEFTCILCVVCHTKDQQSVTHLPYLEEVGK